MRTIMKKQCVRLLTVAEKFHNVCSSPVKRELNRYVETNTVV